jgi:hypothetical protein
MPHMGQRDKKVSIYAPFNFLNLLSSCKLKAKKVVTRHQKMWDLKKEKSFVLVLMKDLQRKNLNTKHKHGHKKLRSINFKNREWNLN